MKVLVFILLIVVVIMMLLQTITRLEIVRLRQKEIALDAQMSVMQERITDVQMNQQAGLQDYNRLDKLIKAHQTTNEDVFYTVNDRIDKIENGMAEQVKRVKEECPFSRKKKTTEGK